MNGDAPITGASDRSLASLVTELTRGSATLIRQEVNLAKTELAEKVGQAQSGLIAAVAGGLLLFIALQALAAAAILGLSKEVEPWLAAVIIGVAVALVGAVVLAKGIANLKGDNLAPRRTIDTLRANARWGREQTQ
jgi:hypothetical protein